MRLRSGPRLEVHGRLRGGLSGLTCPAACGRRAARPTLGKKQPQRQHDRHFASRKRQRYQGLAVEVSRIVGVQLEIALYEFYEGQLPLQESLRLMNDLGFVPAIIDPIGYYDATDPCRLMEMDGVFIRRRHPT